MATNIPRMPPPKTAPTQSAEPAQSAPVETAPSTTGGVPRMPPKKPPARSADETGNSFLYDVFHSQPADLSRPQTWRDWFTRTYNPSVKDVGSAALDDVSMGTADAVQSLATGESIDAIRKRTAASQAALGPLGPIINAATYVTPGIGAGRYLGPLAKKTAGTLGRYGAAGLEGAGASGLSSVGHQVGGDIDLAKVGGDAALGAAAGVGGQAVGDVTAPVVRYVADYVTGKPGRGGTGPIAEEWRARQSVGQDIHPEVTRMRQSTVPGSAEDIALTNLQNSLIMSTNPGAIAKTIKGAGILGAGALGWQHGGGAIGGLFGLGSAREAIPKVVDPIARGINQWDRNIRVNQSLDRLYPVTGLSSPTTNVEPWADALRQLSIGSAR